MRSFHPVWSGREDEFRTFVAELPTWIKLVNAVQYVLRSDFNTIIKELS
jgi:hypothetical protein